MIAYVGAARASTAPYAREWDHLQKRLGPERLQVHFAFSREMSSPQGGKLYVQVGCNACMHARLEASVWVEVDGATLA